MKSTVTVQVASAARVAVREQVVAVSVKLPVRAMASDVMATVLVLVTVKVWVAEVPATSVEGKVAVAGVRVAVVSSAVPVQAS